LVGWVGWDGVGDRVGVGMMGRGDMLGEEMEIG
jgi:hypothetical protein